MKKLSNWLLLGIFFASLVTAGCTTLAPKQLAAGPDEYWVNSQYHIDDPNEFDPDLDWEN